MIYEGWHGLGRGEFLWMESDEQFRVPATRQKTNYIAGHSLWVVAPVLLGNWSYLGEPSKIVKASARRVASLSSNSETLTATLLLAPREKVTVAVLSPKGEVMRAACVADWNGVATAYDGDRDVALTLTCERASCSCNS